MALASTNDRIELQGAPGSPYTRKMLAYLRYRQIAYAVRWGGMLNSPDHYPKPKVRLLPTFYFKDADGKLEAAVDSTPIIRRLESEYDGRSAIPDDPVMGFVNYLIEDYADEWLTKAMFHYRWAHQADVDNAGPLLIYWAEPTMAQNQVEQTAAMISKRQIDRLYVVGSNDVTGDTIESSYTRLLEILDTLITEQGYVLGTRPSSADFALYGQLTQLALVDPTPAAIVNSEKQRVRAWVDRVDDLSGVDVITDGWISADKAKTKLNPLLAEIGRVYAPVLLANAKAVMAGEESFEAQIDGRAWTQPSFPYQAKCLQWINEAYGALSSEDQTRVRDILDGTGCEAMLL